MSIKITDALGNIFCPMVSLSPQISTDRAEFTSTLANRTDGRVLDMAYQNNTEALLAVLHDKWKVLSVIARSRLIQTVPLSELSDCFLIIHDLLLYEALPYSWFAELMFRGAHGLSHKPLSAKSGKDRFVWKEFICPLRPVRISLQSIKCWPNDEHNCSLVSTGPHSGHLTCASKVSRTHKHTHTNTSERAARERGCFLMERVEEANAAEQLIRPLYQVSCTSLPSAQGWTQSWIIGGKQCRRLGLMGVDGLGELPWSGLSFFIFSLSAPVRRSDYEETPAGLPLTLHYSLSLSDTHTKIYTQHIKGQSALSVERTLQNEAVLCSGRSQYMNKWRMADGHTHTHTHTHTQTHTHIHSPPNVCFILC